MYGKFMCEMKIEIRSHDIDTSQSAEFKTYREGSIKKFNYEILNT